MRRRWLSGGAWLLVLAVLSAAAWRGGLWRAGTAFAVGDLTIDWGVPTGDPIFTVLDMMPGHVEERTVAVTNNASSARPVGVRGAEQAETSGLSDALEITILEGGAELYGGAGDPRSLSDFFSDSAGENGIPLLQMDPGETATLAFRVALPAAADNEWQGGSVTLDITLGVIVAVPAECAGIAFDGVPIFGSERSELLRGTGGNDLIFGLEGSDVIRGRGGDDCLVGGAGSDALYGQGGDDVLLGEGGGDGLYGGNGEDVLYGGDGSDELRGGNGDDAAFGGEGGDGLSGGSGDDELFGEGGDDGANGGRGVDRCEAEGRRNCEL